MPMLKPGEKLDFLRRQVLTSRDVRGGWFVDHAMGGLNYQVEHHLVPHLPTPHLPKAQREALGHLHRVGEPIRQARRELTIGGG
jgi:fatty acid desaturase